MAPIACHRNAVQQCIVGDALPRRKSIWRVIFSSRLRLLWATRNRPNWRRLTGRTVGFFKKNVVSFVIIIVLYSLKEMKLAWGLFEVWKRKERADFRLIHGDHSSNAILAILGRPIFRTHKVTNSWTRPLCACHLWSAQVCYLWMDRHHTSISVVQ